MKIKKAFSFNEEKDAEEIILNGFPDNTIDYNKIYLVAKYLRQTFSYGAIRLEKELIKFCQKQDKFFNPVTEAETIKKWIKSAMNYNLRKIESVIVSQKEIDFLKTIQNPKERKILFVTLILSKTLKQRATKKNKQELKTSDNYYVRYNNFQDIIRLSGLNGISEVSLADIFYKHKKNFTFYSPEKELIKLDFVDIKPDNPFVLSDLENIMNYYDAFFGKPKPAGICEKCGESFEKNSNKQKYCKNCSKVLRREQKRSWIKKSREKS